MSKKPLPETFAEEVPVIKIIGNKLTISITKEQLIFVIENSPERFKVNKPKELLHAFKKHLENYQTGNAVELGISELQYLFDMIAEQIIINEDDILLETTP